MTTTNINKKQLVPIVALSSVAVGIMGVVPNADADYHKGWIWDSTNHSAEFDNGKVPIAFDTSELSSNLVLESGTTINQIYTDMENAVDEWDTQTDFPTKRKDTTTFYHDNVVGTADLAAGTLGSAATSKHFLGFDDHITRVTIDFNHDDFEWDHNGDDSGTSTARIYNVMLHEMGHVNGLCDTYVPAGTLGDCHGHVVSTTVMDSYQYGVVETITTGDQTEVNGQY